MGKELPSPDGWTPVKVVGSGKQFGPNTLEAPKDDQDGRSEPGHENKGPFFKEFVRRGLGAAAALAVAVGGILGLGHAAKAVNEAHTTTTCQDFTMSGQEHFGDNLVGINSNDRGRIQAFLDENGGDGQIGETSLDTVVRSSDPRSSMFVEGTDTKVCVSTSLTGSNIMVSYDTSNAEHSTPADYYNKSQQ